MRKGCYKLIGVVFFIAAFLSAMTIHEGIGALFSMQVVVLSELTAQPFGPHSLTFNDISNRRRVWDYLDGEIAKHLHFATTGGSCARFRVGH